MAFVILVFLIFIITAVFMLVYSPDEMGEQAQIKVNAQELWGVIRTCQTAGFGKPKLTVRPARRSVTMDMWFLDADRVTIVLPLTLKKQQKSKARYLELLRRHNLKVLELNETLKIEFDRADEGSGKLIADLYKDIFEASDSDIVNVTVHTLKSDMRQLKNMSDPNVKFHEDYTFEAPSAKYQGKSVSRVLSERIFGAVYILLYPPLVLLSYKFTGLIGMCWAALIFFAFFAIYNPLYKASSIPDSLARGSLLYCLLLSATLATQNIGFLQSIPSIIGASSAIIACALAIGIADPKSKKSILQKKRKPSEFKAVQWFCFIAGLGLLAINEWARRRLEIEDWVFFFGFMRIEMMIAMIIIFAPTYTLFLLSKERANNK